MRRCHAAPTIPLSTFPIRYRATLEPGLKRRSLVKSGQLDKKDDPKYRWAWHELQDEVKEEMRLQEEVGARAGGGGGEGGEQGGRGSRLRRRRRRVLAGEGEPLGAAGGGPTWLRLPSVGSTGEKGIGTAGDNQAGEVIQRARAAGPSAARSRRTGEAGGAAAPAGL